MKALVSLRVEIIEGNDRGYVLEEQNRCVELEQLRKHPFKPYSLTVEFMTPNLYRELNDDFSDSINAKEV